MLKKIVCETYNIGGYNCKIIECVPAGDVMPYYTYQIYFGDSGMVGQDDYETAGGARMGVLRALEQFPNLKVG